MKFVKATCPGCGASLELADHLQSATCPNCGSKILIEWETKQNPAANLELAKRLIQAKNYKEADAQLTRVLEVNPDNKEAWIWKWVAGSFLELEQILTSFSHQSNINPERYLANAGFSMTEIAQRTSHILDGEQLYMLSGRGKNPERIPLAEAAQRANVGAIPSHQVHQDRVHELQHKLQLFIVLRASQEEYKGSRVAQNFDGYYLFDLVNLDPAVDWIELEIPDRDWRGKLNGKKKRIREKPSYWRSYIAQWETAK